MKSDTKSSHAALSNVEQAALADSQFQSLYAPEEKIHTIVVSNFPTLGKLAALRFIEWAQGNPGGVISLPTGKSPEHFIKHVQRFLRGWDTPEIRQDLQRGGIDPTVKPDMKSLHFVQIDEFYPINSSQHNSFCDYVKKFYIEGFGLDESKCIFIDCNKIGLSGGQTLESVWPDGEVDLTLRCRPAADPQEQIQKDMLAKVDQWCQEYEEKIRAMGGIGFFMGGIGPDGHIAFNVRGSDHYSTTRLCQTNYETQAAAAGDLGGIEISRKRLVITIGLGTITFNPKCVALIIAAGEAKAQVVAKAILSEPNIDVPASSLHKLPGARFYLTLGAARDLSARQASRYENGATMSQADAEKIVVDHAVMHNKSLIELQPADFQKDCMGKLLIERYGSNLQQLCMQVRDDIIARIDHGAGMLQNTRFLHTEPHHDDIMLGYLPGVVRQSRQASNQHTFVCLTSGFTAVTNAFMTKRLEILRGFMDSSSLASLDSQHYFRPENQSGRQRDVWRYLDGIAQDSRHIRWEGIARRFLRDLITVFGETSFAAIKTRIAELEQYFASAYPGKKDQENIQKLKGMCREFEAECLWGYLGWNCDSVMHMRLGFYTGDIFTKEPTVDRDAAPVLKVLEKTKPDIVTVALDPEASGPDTHYKVLQVIAQALRIYQQNTGRSNIRVWGYRNVWYRFHPCEANMYIPVSLNMFATMKESFLNAFVSQKSASFPSPDFDGPFCQVAQQVQVQQYQAMKTCLGRQWFYDHSRALIRATRGLVFVKDMSLEEFYSRSSELKKVAEES